MFENMLTIVLASLVWEYFLVIMCIIDSQIQPEVRHPHREDVNTLMAGLLTPGASHTRKVTIFTPSSPVLLFLPSSATLLQFVPQLEELDVSWNELIGGCLTALTSHLQYVGRVRVLRLCSCRLNADDITALGGSSFLLVNRLLFVSP